MVKILLSEKVNSFLEKAKTGLQYQFKKKISKLKENSLLGDYIFGVENIDCREIKVEGLRFFTLQYREQNFVLDEDEFKDIIKIIDFAKKNKSKEQQNIIDDIKKRVKEFGMDI
jgi:hypothetical protein